MKKLTIARRLALGFAALIVVVGALAVTSLIGLSRIDAKVGSIINESLPGLSISNHAFQQTLNLRVLMLREVASTVPSETKELDQQGEALLQKTIATFKAYEPTIFAADDRENFNRLESAFKSYEAIYRRIRSLAMEGKKTEASTLATNSGVAAYQAFEEAMIKIVSWNEKSAENYAAGIVVVMGSARQLTITIAGGALIIAILASMLITRSVNRAIREVAESLNDASQQVSAAASQVSSASQSLAEGASEQAASLEETSASLEEVSSMTKRNAEGAQQAKELSKQTRAAADTAATAMEEMKRAMDAIKASSDGVSKIIKTIDEIAFQTNILALNAAVEAARAGEAGMGFAVVADEVRNLAQRSAQSSKETAAKIDEAIQKSEYGVRISSKVALSLGEILEKARKVDTLVAEIATASLEQNQGIGQVNTAVSQMDQVTQTNASSAEETAAAAEELSAQSVMMRENVGQLMLLIGRKLIDTSANRSAANSDARGSASFGGSTKVTRQRSQLSQQEREEALVAEPVTSGNGEHEQEAHAEEV